MSRTKRIYFESRQDRTRLVWIDDDESDIHDLSETSNTWYYVASLETNITIDILTSTMLGAPGTVGR